MIRSGRRPPISLKWAIPVSLVFAILSFPVMVRALFDSLMGGHGWRQGDWLINFGAGFVRRGTMGEAIIWLSDTSGLDLLLTVQAVQVSLFVALVFVTWLIALGHRDRPLVVLLAASPGFFLIFWAGDLQGTMRKEVFGYLALALLCLNAVFSGRSLVLPVLAVLAYTLGCIGNVMHSFMLPPLIVGLWLTHAAGQISRPAFLVLAGVATAMSLLWLGIALIFREVAELDGLCGPLLVRGLDGAICNDALRWLVAGEVDHLGEVVKKLTPTALIRYAGVAVLVLVPVTLAAWLVRDCRMLAVLLLLALIPMLPLYAIATDWGRWLSIAYSSFAFLVLQADATGRLSWRQDPPLPLCLGLFALALLISHEHTIGWQPGGAARSVVAAATDLF